MVLHCLAWDDEREPGLRSPVVRVLRARDRAPSGEWVLRVSDPVKPLLAFARLRRATSIVVGERAWERWGPALAAAAKRANGRCAVREAPLL